MNNNPPPLLNSDWMETSNPEDSIPSSQSGQLDHAGLLPGSRKGASREMSTLHIADLSKFLPWG